MSNFLIDFCTNQDDVYQNIDYISDILLKHKIVGFKNLTIDDKHFGDIMIKLYRGTQNPLDLKPGTIYNQNHLHDEDTLDENIEHFIYGRWHVDNPFHEEVPCYTGMHMKTFTCSPFVGQTYFLDLSYLYKMCPNVFLEKLANIKLLNVTGFPEENIHQLTPHPAVIIHPITMEEMIYWTGHDIRLTGGHSEDWFEEFKIWVAEFISDAKNRKSWNWNQGDVLIWDNRAVAHSFSPGWKHSERIFSRCEVGFERLIPKNPI